MFGRFQTQNNDLIPSSWWFWTFICQWHREVHISKSSFSQLESTKCNEEGNLQALHICWPSKLSLVNKPMNSSLWVKSTSTFCSYRRVYTKSPTVRLQAENPAVRVNWGQLATTIYGLKVIFSSPNIHLLRGNWRKRLYQQTTVAGNQTIKLEVSNAAVDNCTVYIQLIPLYKKWLLLCLWA